MYSCTIWRRPFSNWPISMILLPMLLLQSVYGIGRIGALTILYEIENIRRFPRVQDFVSYARLVKCEKSSAGKSYGTSGNKSGQRSSEVGLL